MGPPVRAPHPGSQAWAPDTLMKSIRALQMWVPLGRKKQLPGLSS